MDHYRDIETETRISSSGLRYTAKKPGSTFGPGCSATMSCFWCGRHKPISAMANKKILGRNQKVCAVSCRKKT
ncbi:hypothetical protein [Azohydromonas australica]|uniref:hypothetical protein n=1 Tax=Azohydromonas australica TaxID=364039 RepID=UPI000A04F4D4|nr:hypothetical protein [Azohydromonas australica]